MNDKHRSFLLEHGVICLYNLLEAHIKALAFNRDEHSHPTIILKNFAQEFEKEVLDSLNSILR
ncbi:unnamed protein product [Candida parapsilosis]